MASLRDDFVKGDHKAFDKVFDSYYHKLVAFIGSYINNLEEARDIAQSSLIALWEKKDNLRSDTPLEPYLFKIAKNATLDHIKALKIRREYISKLKNDPALLALEMNEISFELFDVDKFNAKSLKKKIIAILSGLPFAQRHVFILSRFNNLTNNEIATILNISPKTVEKRINIVLKILRKEIVLIIITLQRFSN